MLTGRLILSAIFLLSAVGKLSDRDGTRSAIRAFGIPAILVTPVGIVLPVVELVIAGALLPASSAPWAGAGAAVLLLGFLAAMVVNLAIGRRPECHCFGRLRAAPVGWLTVARNVALLAVAAVIAFAGTARGPSVVVWIADTARAAPAVLILAVGAAAGWGVTTWLCFGLVRQHGRLLLRLAAIEATLAEAGMAVPSPADTSAALPVGSVAPRFSLGDMSGRTVSLDDLRAAGKPVLLVFSDPGCRPCAELLPEFARWQELHSGAVTFSLISRGPVDGSGEQHAAQTLSNVLFQRANEVATAYHAAGTPSAVVVAPDGRVATALAQGATAIRVLLTGVLAAEPGRAGSGPAAGAARRADQARKLHQVTARPAAPLRLGEAAPRFALPDLDGLMVGTAELTGRPAVLLFWNPSCRFCQEMFADVKAWDAQHDSSFPRLALISSGGAEANRRLGLSSSIMLDEDFATGRAFGASGTPSAVRLDAQGRIDSPIAVGRSAVASLMAPASANRE